MVSANRSGRLTHIGAVAFSEANGESQYSSKPLLKTGDLNTFSSKNFL